MKIEIIKLNKLFFIPDPAKLCAMPYPGHKKGCPNLWKSFSCPPKARKLSEKYDLIKDCYLIVQPFDLATHKSKMKSLHPEWSDKQCACVLYWQNGVRKKLKDFCFNFCIQKECKKGCDGKYYKEIGNNICYAFDLIPEAMGLNVFSTARYHGIQIERNPQNIVYKIAFAGVLK